MTQFKRVAFIGNSLPRRCGIATFTTDLHKAVQSSGAQIEPCIVAMNDDRRAYDYPPEVTFQIRDWRSCCLCRLRSHWNGRRAFQFSPTDERAA